MTPTVLITDNDMGPADLERAELEPAGYRVVHADCRTEDDVLDAVRSHRPVGLLVQYAPITERVLRAAPDVKALFRYGIGMDNVDLDAARALGVDVLVAVGGDFAARYGGELVPDAAAAVERVRELVEPGDVVLVKASRAAALERVADALAPAEVAA